MTTMALETSRLLGAGAMTLAYAGLCAWAAWRHRRQASARQKQRAALAAATQDAEAWTVAYASQTGSAEELAWRTAQTLHLAGVPVHVCTLDELATDALMCTPRLLLIASTYGEGDPPDNGTNFARRMGLADEATSFAHLRHAVLALGDITYGRYCGFGRTLDAWLRERGGQPFFDRIDVDRLEPEALNRWFDHVAHIAGVSNAVEWEQPTFAEWRLVARRLMNEGSQGEPVFHIELAPPEGQTPHWEAGDLAQLMPPTDAASASSPQAGDRGRMTPREYSIASLPSDGRLHLLVRLRRDANGATGLMSSWLGLQARIGDTVPTRLRTHKTFRIGDNADKPLILIGNGTGMAGLRAHLKARSLAPKPAACWLLFGERQAAHDHHYRDEWLPWQQAGWLTRVDAVFSRDQAEARYVQHRLLESGDALREWMAQGAAIYVCGSLAGMAAGVDEALRQLLGNDEVDALARQGRYRRDVY
jgi:sulfite reductase (NADPH) flavoprotein alpha-component